MKVEKIIIIANALIIIGYGLQVLITNDAMSPRDSMIIYLNTASLFVNMLADKK